MRVLLVANYKPDRQRSMARYAELLHAELRKRGYAAEVIHPTCLAARLVRRESPFFRWLAYLDKFVFFPPVLWLRARRMNLVHICDHSNSYYLGWTGKTPSLITAHDALAIRSALGHFPQNPTRWSGVRFQRWILRGLASAKNMVCVSQKTQRDFEALLPGNTKLTVIPNPLSSNFSPAGPEDVAVVRSACGLAAEDEYLLQVGKGGWYKNRPGVFRIVTELRKFPRFSQVKLVLAGDSTPDELKEIPDAVQYPAPSDQQLRALYSGALALLFPSLEEGFGWPILEAQACGCPVITSARSPMKEVAGGAAILIDPENAIGAAAEIASRIHELDSLRRAGLENVRNYSVANAMDRYCEVYHEIVSAEDVVSIPAADHLA
ncbi:MAG TPA: glycosyltransferase family 1 protein [Candidatus Acidoferrales bacterium]|nr:glycosyltransferase family 1 protein [Candidatus Acidoferrales bacterium]